MLEEELVRSNGKLYRANEELAQSNSRLSSVNDKLAAVNNSLSQSNYSLSNSSSFLANSNELLAREIHKGKEFDYSCKMIGLRESLFEGKLTPSQFAYLSSSYAKAFWELYSEKAVEELKESIRFAPKEFAKVKDNEVVDKAMKAVKEGKEM